MKLARTALLAAAALLAACSRGNASEPAGAPAAPAAAHRDSAALPRLVFFMNPNGMPCQLQDRVLREMGAELSGRAQIVYFKTTEPGDIARFQEYGIRSLPQLVVTDPSGRELRRATPGIHDAPEVIRLLTF
jgi:thioredoxin 1